jgi:hypothetical protein
MLELTVRDPSGGVLLTSRSEPMNRAKAQYLMYAGKRRPAAGWPPGTYQGEVSVLRGGRAVASRAFQVTLRPAG